MRREEKGGLVFGAARPDELEAIHALLRSCRLPVEDVRPDTLRSQLVCRDEANILGTVGFDLAGRSALLRSLAVAPAARGRGIASRLSRAAEEAAAAAGATHLFLLTETAADFATRRGFEPIDRAAVPPEVAALRQFASSCCARAACMIRPAAWAGESAPEERSRRGS